MTYCFYPLVLLFSVFLIETAQAQEYLIGKSREQIKSEIKGEYIVKSIENGLSKEVLSSKRPTPILTVKWGSIHADRNGNFKSIYYFKNNKCFAIREDYTEYEKYNLLGRFVEGEKKGNYIETGPLKWVSPKTKIEYGILFNGSYISLYYGI